MGFKPKARKAKAKEKARVEWVLQQDREDDMREKKELREEAEAKAKAAKGEAQAAKSEADSKSVADADAHADAKSEPESKSKSEVEAKAVADAGPKADDITGRNDFRPKRRRELFHYFARLEECGPFDVDYFTDSLLYGMVKPFPYQARDVFQKMVDNCVRHAIQFAKKEKKMELEDPKVLRVNYEMDGDFMFYITFDATDKKYGMSQLYEAKVLYTNKDYFRRNPDARAYVRIMRLKKNQQRNLVIEDYRSPDPTLTYPHTEVFKCSKAEPTITCT